VKYFSLSSPRPSLLLRLFQTLSPNIPLPAILTAALLSVAAPAEASRLESWRYDPGQNRLEFTTDDDVQPRAQLVSDPVRLVIDLPGIRLDRPVVNQPFAGAIRSVRVGQFDRSTTRLVVELAPGYTIDPQQVKFRGATARQWSVQLPAPKLASTSTVLLPVGSDSKPTTATSVPAVVSPIVSGPPNRSSFVSVAPDPSMSQLATIRAIDLERNGSQLLIRADQGLNYTTGWDRRSGSYKITINSARFASNIQGPQLNASSPILKIRLRQEDARTAVILLQPASGVQFGEMNQPAQQTLALQLQRTRPALVAPPGNSLPSNSLGTIPVPAPPRSTAPVRAIPRPSNGRMVVVVDPGHGGPDPGAIGIGGLQEKDIVLDISIQVAQLLEQQGIQAVLTRQNDIDLDLEPRVQLAEQVNATAFVSIHANSISLSRPDISGLETYYYDSGAELAQSIHTSVLEGTGVNDRRVRTARFYVLRRTSMPSVLVEVGFVTGRDDAARLSNPSYRRQMATAIVRGILQYLQRNS
jgi:N-acetylmuramoyl-L-alanine amidase